MKIKGLDGLSVTEIQSEVERGAKFVLFSYCFSIIVITFQRSSDIYFMRPHESAIKYGWPWLIISLLFGWWGIPWGPIYTIQAIFKSFSGQNVTAEVLGHLKEDSDSE